MIRYARLARRVVTGLVLLTLAGCSDDRRPLVATQTPSPSPSATQTESGSYGGGEPCPDVEAGIGCRSVVSGDIDGDGGRDHVYVQAEVAADGFPASWKLFVETAAGRTTSAAAGWWPEQSIGAPPKGTDWWIGYPEAMATLDIDGDGRDEALIKIVEHVLHGGSVPDVALFRLHGGRLQPLRDADGEPFIFTIGGLPSYGDGLRCRDVVGNNSRELIRVRVENAVYPEPRWKRSVYVFKGMRLLRVARSTGTMVRQGFPDPRINAFYELRCDGVRL